MLVGALAYLTARALGYGDPNSKNWLKRNTKPWQHAVFWASAAGAWKEHGDNKHAGVRGSWPDFTKTVFGGVVIGVTLHYAIKPRPEQYATAPRLAPLPLEPLPMIPTIVGYPEMVRVVP
jgi:hypothetical protein